MNAAGLSDSNITFYSQVYVGGNYYVFVDTWELMLMKHDSKFIRDMAEVLWGRVLLKKRCLKKTLRKVYEEDGNVIEVDDQPDVKVLTPYKYQLVKGTSLCTPYHFSNAKTEITIRPLFNLCVWFPSIKILQTIHIYMDECFALMNRVSGTNGF